MALNLAWGVMVAEAGKRTPSVLVVGAGAVGLCVAYHLAERGCRDVVVVDRGQAGGGASSKAAGGLRYQFSTEINVRLSQLSLPFFEHAAETLAEPIPYQRVGYLILARTAEQAAAFERNVALQRRLGVDATWLPPEAIGRRWPFLRLDGVVAATWCPDDALTDQVLFISALARRVRAMGVEVREGVEVRSLRAEGERVRGVETTAGPLEAETTVLAAGNGATPLGRTIGLELRGTPVWREIHTTGPVPGLPDDMPFIADFDIGRYARRDAQGFRVSGRIDVAADPQAPFDPARGPKTLAHAAELIPALAGARLTGGWAGVYEVTPDHHAILGPAPGRSGLILATGFGGHGLMHAPAAGRLVAELILDGRATTLDIAPLAADRFERGELLRETVVAPYHEQGDVLIERTPRPTS